MNKNGKLNKTKKCTSTNCEPKIDLNEKNTISKKKHSKKGNLNGLVNGIVQDSTKGAEKKSIEDRIITSNDEDTYTNKKLKPQKEISNAEEGTNKDSKSKLTKLDSNDNISSNEKMPLEPSQEPDLSCNLSNNSTTNEDSIASCSNKATSSSEEKISDLAEDLDKVKLQQLQQPQRELPPIKYVQYESELQMPMIMKIIQKDLSEPYSIYTYRYFIHNWPKLCFLVSRDFPLSRITRLVVGDVRRGVRGGHRLQARHPPESDKKRLHRDAGGGPELPQTGDRVDVGATRDTRDDSG